uniref:Uncharacterized protein n=1 Tax=Anguilla anguilla TaxID=7936 RepID=A0A0E9SKP6_ANGAN
MQNWRKNLQTHSAGTGVGQC